MISAYFKHLFSSDSEPDRSVFWVGYFILLPLYLAPLFVTPLLPGLDLPFHLAMTDMLLKNGHVGSPYAAFFTGKISVAPYAAHYMALMALAALVPLVTAHKLVIVAYVAGMPLAASALLGACGRSRVPALLAFPLAYNLTLHYGFVSFALSLPVMMWWLAELTGFLVAERLSFWRWSAAALLGLLLFLCHLQNFLYGLCAALAFLWFAGTTWRRKGVGFLALLPSLGALALWQVRPRPGGDPHAESKTLAFAWKAVRDSRLSDLEGGSVIADLTRRMQDLKVHTLRGFTDMVDVDAAQMLFLVLLIYGVLGLGGRWVPGNPGCISRPRMRIAGWIAFAGAVIAYLGLPHHLPVFELMTFSPRFSVLMVLMALLVVPAGLKRFIGPARWLVLLPAVVLGVLYGQVLITHYRAYGVEVAEFQTVVAKIPPGGKVVGLVYDRASRVMRIESALVGLPNLYPAEQPAPGSFVNLPYCGMRHMPCAGNPQAYPPAPHPWRPADLRPELAVPFFDYFIVRSPPPHPLFGAQGANVALFAQKGTWFVYKANHRAVRSH